MEHGVFLNAKFAQTFRDRCLIVRVNFMQHRALIRRHRIDGTPAFLVLDHKGKRLGLESGSMSLDEMTLWLKKTLAASGD